MVHHDLAEVVEAVPELRAVGHAHQLLVRAVKQDHTENEEEQTTIFIGQDPLPVAALIHFRLLRAFWLRFFSV